MRKIRVALVLLVGLLPAWRVKNRLLNALGNHIHPSARISPILLLDVGLLEMGEGSDIWLGNRFVGLRHVRLGADVTVMGYNHIWADRGVDTASSPEPELAGLFSLDDHSVVNKGHSLDCTGGFLVGSWSGLGGRHIGVFTHELDPQVGAVVCAPTRVGSNSMVAARTTLAVGSRLPDFCALGIGALLLPGADKTHHLYGGIPAKPLRAVGDWKAMAERTSRRPDIQR